MSARQLRWRATNRIRSSKSSESKSTRPKLGPDYSKSFQEVAVKAIETTAMRTCPSNAQKACWALYSTANRTPQIRVQHRRSKIAHPVTTRTITAGQAQVLPPGRFQPAAIMPQTVSRMSTGKESPIIASTSQEQIRAMSRFGILRSHSTAIQHGSFVVDRIDRSQLKPSPLAALPTTVRSHPHRQRP